MKRGFRRRFVITIVLVIIAFAGLVVRGITYTLSHLTPYGELAPRLMPTAEYLERNPIQTPHFIGAYLRPERNELCLGMTFNTFPSSAARATLDAPITVDRFAGQRITIDGYFTFGSRFESITGQTECFDVSKLSVGLHLASVHVTTRDGVEHAYTWAFRIDPTPDA